MITFLILQPRKKKKNDGGGGGKNVLWMQKQASSMTKQVLGADDKNAKKRERDRPSVLLLSVSVDKWESWKQKSLSKAEIFGASAAKLSRCDLKVLKIHWFRFLELAYFISCSNSETYTFCNVTQDK